MEINPFDEPNVQESKDRTKALLSQYARDGRFPLEGPLLIENGVSVYGTLNAAKPAALNHCLAEWLQQGRPSDYVAILSFLPRTTSLDEAVHALRDKIGRVLGSATTVGFGPRYLHSTGQLYKGGPDAAIFLELTADEPNDLPVPGEPFTFGVLKQAQALGDFQAVQQKGRRILRVHLKGDLDRTMQRLTRALDEALTSLLAGRSLL
jgi:hypothetical protein